MDGKGRVHSTEVGVSRRRPAVTVGAFVALTSAKSPSSGSEGNPQVTPSLPRDRVLDAGDLLRSLPTPAML